MEGTATLMKRLLPQTTAGRALAGILVVYVLSFFWLACRKWQFDTGEGGDIAVVNHIFWSSLHGKFFWHFTIDRSYFAEHQEALVFVVWPLYALIPDVRTLFLVQTICISLSGVVMFLIARRVLKDDLSAVLMAVALLFFPSVVSQNVNQLHTSQWVLPLLMACFYFFLTENYRWFVAFCIFAALGKENTPLTLLVFVPYALWKRRGWRWWVAPLAVSAVALVVDFKIVGPYFAHGWRYEALGYLGNLGGNWSEVFHNILFHPSKLWAAFNQPDNGPYLIHLLQPALWLLPFLAPEVLFAVPDLFVNLIAGNNGMKVVAWHYNVYTGAFLVLASLFAVPRLEALLRKRFGSVSLCPVLPMLICVMSIAHWPFWFSPYEYQPLPHYDTQVRARALIPAGVPVLYAPDREGAFFSDRSKFSNNIMVKDDPQQMFHYDWVYLDMNFARMYPPIPKSTLMAFANNPDYQCLFAERGIYVFQRKPGSLDLSAPVAPPPVPSGP